MDVSTNAIFCWFLTAEYFFYATGHQASFVTIHWDAAFIGTGGHFYGNFLPAILIGNYCEQKLILYPVHTNGYLC